MKVQVAQLAPLVMASAIQKLEEVDELILVGLAADLPVGDGAHGLRGGVARPRRGAGAPGSRAAAQLLAAAALELHCLLLTGLLVLPVRVSTII